MSIIKSIRKFIAKDCKHILEGYDIILEDMSRSDRDEFVRACSRNILNMLVYPDPLKYHYHHEWVIELLFAVDQHIKETIKEVK